MSVSTRGLSDIFDALTGGNQDDENKSKIHVTDEVQMHRLAASSAGSSSSLCLPGLPSCERGYELCSGPTEYLEDAHGHAAANDLFPDGAHACAGGLQRLRQQQPRVQRTQLKDLEDRQDRQGPPEPASGAKRQIWPDHKQDPSNQRVA